MEGASIKLSYKLRTHIYDFIIIFLKKDYTAPL